MRMFREGRPELGRHDLTERKLVQGWASVPRVRVRQAVAADLPEVRELSAVAGPRVEDELAEAVADGRSGSVLRAGLRGGREEFARHLAGEFFRHRDDPARAHLAASLVLVAEHQDDGVVGTLIACPPVNLTAMHLQATRKTITDPRERDKLMMAGAIGAAKVKAVAVKEAARGRNIGGSLLQRCRQVYFRCGYLMIYGQMPPRPGLEAFYQRNGFQVLGEGEALDLWVVFGVHSRIDTGDGERFFVRYAPAD
jgi:GNAT superfamily N-acetyltransferase